MNKKFLPKALRFIHSSEQGLTNASFSFSQNAKNITILRKNFKEFWKTMLNGIGHGEVEILKERDKTCSYHVRFLLICPHIV